MDTLPLELFEQIVQQLSFDDIVKLVQSQILPEDKQVYLLTLLAKYSTDKYIIFNLLQHISPSILFNTLVPWTAKQKNNALVEASRVGNTNTVQILLQHGAKIDAGQNKPLILASANGHLETVKVLLEHGANPKAQFESPLILASEYNHRKVMQELVNHGASKDAALVFASTQGLRSAVKNLIGFGANPEAFNNQALKLAKQKGHIDLIPLLIPFK